MNATAAPFSLGVNYPWVRYGHDFGRSAAGSFGVSTAETRATVAVDFERIRDSGVNVVRWFLLGDGRGGFTPSNGIPTGADDLLFADVEAALALAEKNELRICFSLFDFLWLQERPELRGSRDAPNRGVLKSAAGREALLETVFIPLFANFKAHPGLFAWEIVNEPEWAIREFGGGAAATMRFADFRAYAEEIAAAVREFAVVPATLGSARLIWLRAWSEIGLDILQAHYYPKLERDQDRGLGGQLARLRTGEPLGKPVWLGELPARDPEIPEYSLEESLDVCREAGLAGAAVWRWRKSEPGDADGGFGTAEPAVLQAWLTRNAEPSV